MTNHLKKLRGEVDESLRRLDQLANDVLQPNIPSQLRTDRGVAAAHNLQGIAHLIRIKFMNAITKAEAETTGAANPIVPE